jgi:hypothetical protein
VCAGAIAHAISVMLFSAPAAFAFEIETNVPDLKVNWETTVKYDLAYRTRDPSPLLIARPPATVNQDDGDRNLRTGPTSNRFDVFSEADVVYRNVGARVSGAGWYDDVYMHRNDNDSPGTANPLSVPYNEFTQATRAVHGHGAEFLDAFVFGNASFDDVQASLRVGQHALLWGESLFFGSNGIAGGQAPVDVVKLLSVPNSLFKEILLPSQQVSGQLRFGANVSLAAYYQYRWRKSRLPGSGSYFSNTDLLDAGGERLLAGAPLVPGGGPAAFFRDADQSARNSGEEGIALRWRAGDYDFGLYALRWSAKTPQVYITPALRSTQGPPVVIDPAHFNPLTGQIGTYRLVYPEDIRTFGGSASTSIGDVNVAGELSVRRHTPLVSDTQVAPPGVHADNRDHPLYAIGNSAHAQVSMLWSMAPNFIAKSATLLAEVAGNMRTSITHNPAALDPNTERSALSTRVVYEPLYRQALAGVDFSVPVGGSYTAGKSSVVSSFGVNKGGDLNIGLTATYLNRYYATLGYTHYYGAAKPAVDALGHFTFGQTLADRDFVALSLRTTF